MRAAPLAPCCTAVLNNAYSQRQISTIYDSLNQYQVVMEVNPKYAQDPITLKQVQVITAAGARIPLSTIAHYENSLEDDRVSHEGQFASESISFDMAEGVTVEQGTAAIERAIAKVGLPEDVIAKMARIPSKFVSKSDTDSLRSLESDLKRVVFGQDNAIEALSAAIKLSRAGLRDPEKPIGNYLFSAPGTHKVTVGGVTYTLNAMGATTVSVSQDTDTLVKNVQSFVDDYNKMIDALNTKYYEKQYSDYGVLTKSQEGAMTADQITKWNEKAKSGLLYHDQTLGKVISSMRQALYTPVDSVTSNYNTMMSIGITSSTDQGHISLDTDKLKKALAADPDCVRQIFASSGDVTTTDADGTTKTTTDYNKEGVLNRISDALHTNLKTMKSYAGNSTETSDGSTLGTLIENLKTKMSDFKTQMDAYEEALYDKYDAMETAIQQLSTQLGYITGGN